MKSDFLHPTTRGGQIRTLEMLRRLHRGNEIHYVAFDDPAEPEGLARASEYCAKAWPIPKAAPRKGSPAFYAEVAGNLFSRTPAVIALQRSAEMRRVVADLLAGGGFDSLVCDFLTPAINVPHLDRCVLFQHNIETMIWRRPSAPTIRCAGSISDSRPGGWKISNAPSAAPPAKSSPFPNQTPR